MVWLLPPVQPHLVLLPIWNFLLHPHTPHPASLHHYPHPFLCLECAPLVVPHWHLPNQFPRLWETHHQCPLLEPLAHALSLCSWCPGHLTPLIVLLVTLYYHCLFMPLALRLDRLWAPWRQELVLIMLVSQPTSTWMTGPEEMLNRFWGINGFVKIPL